jgi:hypothetical protein
MSAFTPADPDFAARVRQSFARQKIMTLIGARLSLVAPGHVEIELPFRDDLTQQHGFWSFMVCAKGLQTIIGVQPRPDIGLAG